MSKRVGVNIGRFQVPSLHQGHTGLLTYTADRCDMHIVILGVSRMRPTYKDPLNFTLRKNMLLNSTKKILHIVPLYDQETDELWSQRIDELIRSMTEKDDTITIYGGKDNCFRYYSGSYHTEVVDLNLSNLHGTNMRNISENSISDIDLQSFRKGVIYGVNSTPPVFSMCVDIAVIMGQRVLLGRKASESLWRFPGGRVDPLDKSLEHAALRELEEETCLKCVIGDLTYIGSTTVPDWRWKEGNPFSAVFVAKNVSGPMRAGDDIVELKWVTFSDVPSLIHPSHAGIWKMVEPHMDVLKSSSS